MADNLKDFYPNAKITVTTVVNIVAAPAAAKTRNVFVRITNNDTVARTCSLAKSALNSDVTDKGEIPASFSVAAGDTIIVGQSKPIVLENGAGYVNFQAATANVFVVSATGYEGDVQ